MSAKQMLISLFQLPQDEIIYQDYGCAYQNRVLKHGRMFVGENYICFYANIMGQKTKVDAVIKIDDIQAIEKRRVLGLIQNAIEIQMKDQKSYFFCSFTDRDSVFQLLFAIWKGQIADFSPEPELLEETLTDGSNAQIDQSIVEVSFLQPDETQEHIELVKATFPVNVDKFFDLFLADEGTTYSVLDHRKVRGDFEDQLSKWQPQEESGFSRELNAVIKLSDVPFKDRSRLYKLQTYKREKYQKNNTYQCNLSQSIILQMMSKTLDVPFANCFQVEEKWEINNVENEANKCQLRISAWVVFLKSTYMKKTIQSRSIQGIKEDYEIYVGNMKKKLEILQQKAQQITNESGAKKPEYEASQTMESTQIYQKTLNQQVKKITLEPKLDRIQDLSKAISPYINILQLVSVLLLLLVLITMLVQNNRLGAIEQLLYTQNTLVQSNEL